MHVHVHVHVCACVCVCIIVVLSCLPPQTILSTMFALLEVENEENVLVCLRIIIELHKHFKPAFSEEVRICVGRSPLRPEPIT